MTISFTLIKNLGCFRFHFHDSQKEISSIFIFEIATQLSYLFGHGLLWDRSSPISFITSFPIVNVTFSFKLLGYFGNNRYQRHVWILRNSEDNIMVIMIFYMFMVYLPTDSQCLPSITERYLFLKRSAADGRVSRLIKER